MRDGRIVYSTRHGRMCPECGKPQAECVCGKRGRPAPPAGKNAPVRVRREVKGRGGKTVTAIDGLPLDDEGLDALAGELKRLCGVGGSVKDGIVLIQGDHRDAIVEELRRRGFAAKAAGG